MNSNHSFWLELTNDKETEVLHNFDPFHCFLEHASHDSKSNFFAGEHRKAPYLYGMTRSSNNIFGFVLSRLQRRFLVMMIFTNMIDDVKMLKLIQVFMPRGQKSR